MHVVQVSINFVALMNQLHAALDTSGIALKTIVSVSTCIK